MKPTYKTHQFVRSFMKLNEEIAKVELQEKHYY